MEAYRYFYTLGSERHPRRQCTLECLIRTICATLPSIVASTFFASVARPKTVRAGTVPVMSQKRKQRAAAPRDLSFGAVQRKLAAKEAAAAAPSPRASTERSSAYCDRSGS